MARPATDGPPGLKPRNPVPVQEVNEDELERRLGDGAIRVAGPELGRLGAEQFGIDGGDGTFETTAPGWEAFDAARLTEHRLVSLDQDGRVLGWAAVVPVSDRCAYAGVVEHSICVHLDARSRGVGAALLDALIASTEAAGIWTIQSGVFPENTASLALHERAGFRVIGMRERIGKHHGRWRDVVLLERRSAAIH